MEISSTLAFIAPVEVLEQIDYHINEESMIDDMVTSVDFISELERSDTYMYRCSSDTDSWVNVYEVQERIKDKITDVKVEIIYASTDSRTFVDVVSFTGNFDAYVDSTDPEMIQEICENYGLPFFDTTVEEDDYDDFYEDDGDSYY